MPMILIFLHFVIKLKLKKQTPNWIPAKFYCKILSVFSVTDIFLVDLSQQWMLSATLMPNYWPSISSCFPPTQPTHRPSLATVRSSPARSPSELWWRGTSKLENSSGSLSTMAPGASLASSGSITSLLSISRSATHQVFD